MSIILPGSSSSPRSGPRVYARSGWQIPTEVVQADDSFLMQLRSRELVQWIRYTQIRSTSAYPYNCVGMIFASRRAWIEIDYIYDILREDGYREIEPNAVMIGDIVLYKRGDENTHVGLIVEIDRELGDSIRVLSKWGMDGEFLHFMPNVPEIFGRPAEFWTERPNGT